MRFVVISGVLVAAVAFSGAARAQNMISNGGFEAFDPSTRLPTGWARADMPIASPYDFGPAFQLFGSHSTGTYPATLNGLTLPSFGATLPSAITGSVSLVSTQVGPSGAAVWQGFTLPTAALRQITVSFNYSAQLLGSTADDVAQVALVRQSALLATGGANSADVVIVRLTAAGGPVTVPVTRITSTIAGSNVSAFAGQALALSFFVGAASSPATVAFDDVSLSWQLLQLGRTRNQIAASTALMGATAAPLVAAFNIIANGTDAQINAALNRVGAPVYAETLQAGLADARAFGGTIQDQLQGRRPGAERPGLFYWGSVYGGTARSGASGNTGGTSNQGGFAVGADAEYRPGLRLGFAIGSGYSNVSARDTGGIADDIGLHVGPYASFRTGQWFANAQMFGTFHDVTTRRDTGFGRTRSSARGFGGSGGFEAGRSLDVAGIAVEPLVGFRVDHLRTDGVTETGSDLALAVKQGLATSARSSMGARVSSDVTLGTQVINLSLKAVWAHEFSQTTTLTEARFAQGSDSFRVISARTGRDAAIVNAYVGANLAPAVAVYARAGMEVRGNYSAMSGSAGLRLGF